MNTKTKKPTGEKLTTAELIKKAKPVSPSLPSGEGQGGVSSPGEVLIDMLEEQGKI